MKPLVAIRYVHKRKVIFTEGIAPAFYEDCTELGTSTASWDDPTEDEVDYGGWYELHPSGIVFNDEDEFKFQSDCNRLYRIFATFCRAFRLSRWKEIDLTVWSDQEIAEYISTMNAAIRQVEWPHLHSHNFEFMALWQYARYILLTRKGYDLTTAPNHGFVYLIRSNTGHYKIGKSVNPQRRITQFVPKNVILPIEFELIHQIETDEYHKVEKLFHTNFADKRFKGEWFDLTDEDVKVFKYFTVVVSIRPQETAA